MKFVTLLLLSGLLLSACSVFGRLDNKQLNPNSFGILLPENEQAAALTAEYLDIMERKLPLLDQIAIVEARDRYARDVFINMFKDPNLDPDVRLAFQTAGGAYIEQIDDINTRQLERVLEGGVSWRDIAEREPFLFNRVFSIVQHSNSIEFRASVLKELEPLVEEKLVPIDIFAMMFDKVELAAGRQQVYGTQYRCVKGRYVAYSLADPSGVDARRKNKGLPPLSEYLAEAETVYGPCDQ